MKTRLLPIIVILFLVLSVMSCKKDHDDGGLSTDIKNFVPQSIIDSMRKWGMTINEGKTPPVINGVYVFSPNYCTFDKSVGYTTSRVRDIFDDYKFKFYNQDNKALTVNLSYKNITHNIDSASGASAFLSGSGNLFTAFINVNGVNEGISYSRIDFYSGEITSTGVSHFQTAFYFTSKSEDPNKQLVEVGSSRIFKDQNDFSDASATYRIVPSPGEGKSSGGTK